jgi:hypothetical protein
MNCQEFSNELQKMLETGITLSSPKLTQHMESCSFCTKQYNRIVLLLSVINKEKNMTPPRSIKSKIMDTVISEGKHTIHIRPIHWYTAAASIAAGVMLGILIGSATYSSYLNVSATNSTEIALQQESYSTPMDDFIFANNDQ